MKENRGNLAKPVPKAQQEKEMQITLLLTIMLRYTRSESLGERRAYMGGTRDAVRCADIAEGGRRVGNAICPMVVGVVLSVCVSVSAAQSSEKLVRVGVYENSPKVGLGKAGTPEGIFVDIISRIAVEEGWSIEFVSGTWMEGLNRLAAGEIDLMPDVAQSKSRGDRFVFHHEPVLSDWFQVYARKGSGIRSLLDLAGKRVAVLDGSIQEEAFEQVSAGFNVPVSILPFPDYRGAFRDVAQGRVDAVVVNRFYGMRHSRDHNLEDTAIIFSPTRLFFALPADGCPHLADAIDRHLLRMKQNPDSIYYASLRCWTSEPAAFRLPRWVRLTGGAAVALVLVCLAWSLTLRRQVANKTVALAQSNRMLRMLSDCNQILIRSTDENRLLGELCRLLLEEGGCTAAWVGILQDDVAGTLRTAAHAGFQDGNLPDVFKLSETDNDEVYESWVNQVIRTNQPRYCDDLNQASDGMRRTFQTLRHEGRSLLCFPLISPRTMIGVLTVIVPEPGPHPDEMQRLLQELASDMAFGIEHLRLEEKRQRAVEEQRDSERRFRQLIEDAPDAIIIQANKRFVYVNPSACELLGASSPDQLLGRSVLDFIHQDNRALAEMRIAQLNAGREYVSAVEETLLRLDGTPVTVEVASAPFQYKDENGALVFVRNITARKLQEHLYENLVEDMPALICRFTPDGVLTFVNGAVCAFLGRSKEEIAGTVAYEFLLPDDRMRVESTLMGTSAERPSTEYTVNAVRADGQLRQMRCLSRAIIGSDGVVSEFQTIAFDMTDQRNLEERLSQTNKLETIGMLAGGVAHDFNNMLQTILGFGELAMLQTPPPDSRASDIQEIITSACRAKRLTGQLLAFSRHIPMEITRLKLNQEIDSRRRMLSQLLGEDVAIVLELDEPIPDILADAGHIEQVLLNLAVNARDAMPDGGTLTLRTSCVSFTAADVRLHPEATPGVYACLAITDTGCGIPSYIQKKIFDPFFTTKPKDKGTGLGLSTVYGIVRQLKGWIHVASQAGRGATFTIFFPVAEGEGTESGGAVLMTQCPCSRDANILVVEDQDKVARVAERILASHGFKIRVAASVAEARAALDDPAAAYDLVFCDVVLGDGNGVELAEAVNLQNPGMRFLFASGYVDERSRWASIKQHGWKCLIKPYPASELLSAVEEALALHPNG